MIELLGTSVSRGIEAVSFVLLGVVSVVFCSCLGAFRGSIHVDSLFMWSR